MPSWKTNSNVRVKTWAYSVAKDVLQIRMPIMASIMVMLQDGRRFDGGRNGFWPKIYSHTPNFIHTSVDLHICTLCPHQANATRLILLLTYK